MITGYYNLNGTKIEVFRVVDKSPNRFIYYRELDWKKKYGILFDDKDLEFISCKKNYRYIDMFISVITVLVLLYIIIM